MPKFKAIECKHFDGVDVTLFERSEKIVYMCNQEHCLDRDDCDRQREEERPIVHFEPIVPPPGRDEKIHTF